MTVYHQRNDDADGAAVEMTPAFGVERQILGIPINTLSL